MTDFKLRVYDNTIDMLSNVDNPTPLVRLNRCLPFKHTQVYAKLEWYNPFGAVKDRVAANLIGDAERRGDKLENLVEPTSGNTGMGLAMISNARGYNFTATLSKAIPLEKRSALRLFGTNLIELNDDLCPMPGQPEGAMAKAAELGKQPGWKSLNQYANPANPEAHYLTTGPEIWRQTGGKVTHFVAGLGTCGTITGTGRYLKEQNPAVAVFGAHPTDGHDIPGVRSRKALALTSFFLPEEYNGVFEITDAEAYGMCKCLILQDSIAAGPTSGMALAAVLKAVPDEPGNVCVVIFPDNAFKYMTSFRKHLPELFGPPEPAAQTAGPFAEQLTAAAKFAENGPDVIGALEALQRVRQGATLVDVRNPNEVAQKGVAGALNVPLGDLTKGPALALPEDLDAPIVTFCAKGKRSVYGMLLLKAQGYRNVKSVYGGMDGWVEAGLPTTAGA